MNDQPVSWYASKTIWASILTPVWPAIAVLATQFHLVLPDEQVVVVDLAAVGSIVSAAVAIYGRVMASRPIAKPSTPMVK